jgi:hypothetical protein
MDGNTRAQRADGTGPGSHTAEGGLTFEPRSLWFLFPIPSSLESHNSSIGKIIRESSPLQVDTPQALDSAHSLLMCIYLHAMTPEVQVEAIKPIN